MYTAHLGVYRRSLVERLGGMREGFEGSQDYDFVLRLVERTDRIHHIPKVLYHWRIHAKSTASEMHAKPYAVQAAQRAITEAIERRGQPGTVLALPDCLGTYIVRYQIGATWARADLLSAESTAGNLDRCLNSILLHDQYADFEVVLLADSADRSMLEACRRWSAVDARVRLPETDVSINPSRVRNTLIAESDARYVLFIDDDTEVVTADWLTALVEQAQRPTIGAVGPLLLGPTATYVKPALFSARTTSLSPVIARFPATPSAISLRFARSTISPQFPAACMMVRREAFSARRRSRRAIQPWPTATSISAYACGARVMTTCFLPHVVLYEHRRPATRSGLQKLAPELQLIQARWRTHELEDPCYNSNLALEAGAYALRV